MLVEVAFGICGSDLHFARHGQTMLHVSKQMSGMPAVMTQPDVNLSQDLHGA
ncbi:MAG: hypothetical protein NVSMB12_18430 [Acidimicrobiales bacterium]